MRPPGVGKTHLAVALGLKAIEHGYRVLFTTAAEMLSTLTKALSESRFDDTLMVYTLPRLLNIDELGDLSIDRQAATLFLRRISCRYEREPTILTSNQSFGRWGDVFGNRVIASAHPRPDAASRDDDQNPGRLLPLEGHAAGRSCQTDDGGNVSGRWTTSVHSEWGIVQCPLTAGKQPRRMRRGVGDDYRRSGPSPHYGCGRQGLRYA